MSASGARLAIVTGAARGIGLSVVEHLAEAGLTVAMVDIDAAVEEGAARLCDQGLVVRAYRADVARGEEVRRIIETVNSELGAVQVLVNNAGVGGPFHLAEEVDEAEWDWIMGVNLKAVHFFTSTLLPDMKAAGFGRIVNIASIQGLVGSLRSSTYVASKHGMIGYTKTVAAEAGPHGITCNAICPGYVDTALGIQEDEVDDYRARVLAKSPVPRTAAPAEIARVVLHLVDEKAGYINGASIVVDGGISAHLGIT